MPNWEGMLTPDTAPCPGPSCIRRPRVTSVRKNILALAILALFAAPALAQPPGVTDALAARLASERATAIAPGRYSAGEGREFTITPYRGQYLLRFEGVSEKFVLSVESGSLGAKLLKYDTGAAVISVSSWGGVTLYAFDAPGGLPATHQGGAGALLPVTVSASELRSALSDEAAHFSYAGDLTLQFVADTTTLAEPDARALAFDTLANVQGGIDRVIAPAAGKRAVARRISTVKLEKAAKPGLALSGRNLVVRYAPQDGYLGRLSSHAVAQQLGKLLALNATE